MKIICKNSTLKFVNRSTEPITEFSFYFSTTCPGMKAAPTSGNTVRFYSPDGSLTSVTRVSVGEQSLPYDNNSATAQYSVGLGTLNISNVANLQKLLRVQNASINISTPLNGFTALKEIDWELNGGYVDVAYLAQLTTLTSVTIANTGSCNLTGDIEAFGTCINLTTLKFQLTNTVSGNVNNMLDAMVAAGRNSGSIVIVAPSATLNGQAVSTSKTINFDANGWSVAT